MMMDRRAMLAALGAAALMPFGRAFGQGATMLRNSIALGEGRIWIAALIDGKGPRLFVIDTGGMFSLIDNDFARREKLDVLRDSRLKGVGGVSDFPYYSADEVRFASGARMTKVLFAGTDARLGRDAVGAFGAGLLTTYDSDLDFVKGEWRAYPAGRGDFTGLTRLESRFKGNDIAGYRIFADATVDGVTSEFMLDTGVPNVLSLDGDTVRKRGLWRDDRPYAPTRQRGIGRGTPPARIVRLNKIDLGPLSTDRPLVMLRQPGTPNFEGAGFIGLPLLERLNLTTDVRRQATWVSPNGRPLPAARSYPLSGVWFDQADGAITVADVGTGSPGAAAGLKVGDRVVNQAFGPLLARANSAAGHEVSLTIERAGARHDVSFRPAPYL